ncbi:DUF3298 domain-containing protein [Hymenobacter sediminis]|uniref:DUF3298 domain-containing protein n=1 Tax=Hymenobacter sediminis TaxID=2218621 RepID=UPI000DA6BD7F|nr:DUF3298 domain-containing protein [Hymenobacter sediminis]RPD50364.1 DUF3298 domain-containing protein [Hymenobacter sediminis]
MSLPLRFRSVCFFCLLSSAGLSALLSGCNSRSDKPGGQTATTPPGATKSEPSLTDSPGTWYRQYRGVLPGSTDSITVHLQRLSDAPGETTLGRLVGFYTASDGHPYELAGDTPADTDSLNLRDISAEVTDKNYVSLLWRLREQGATLVGTRNGRPVQLRLVQPPHGIQLVARSFASKVLARPDHPQDTIMGHVSLHALVPVSGVARKALTANILRGLRGDTLDTQLAPTLDALWKEQLSSFTSDYQQEAGLMLTELENDTSSYRPFATLRYEDQTSTYVLWNEGDLLSIGYFGYYYGGGAHGNYGTTVCSYDTRTGRSLRSADIFRPGTEAQLEKLLGRYARLTLGLKPTQPLSDALFENTLPATSNVYLTSGGAVFVYAPYEVASYAQGEIRVFVPLSALQPLLKPGLPLGGRAEVVRK